MTSNSQIELLLARAFAGQPDALAFITAWHRYAHLIDDVVDGHESPDVAVKIGRWANDIYSSPFYTTHKDRLQPVVQLITCAYEDSLLMTSHGAQPWERAAGDVIRHAGADMVRVVAWIVGGYSLMHSISRDLRSICYHEHHDADGNPI